MIKISNLLSFLAFSVIILALPLVVIGLNASVHNSLVQLVPELQAFGLYNSERQQVVQYVSGQTSTLNLSLSPAELAHMNDIRQLINKGKFISTVGLTLSVVFLLVSWLANKDRKLLLMSWRRVIIYSAVFLLAALLTATIFFQSFFTTLHYLFFPGGNWLFDPGTDLIINIYPPQFFLYFFFLYFVSIFFIITLALTGIAWRLKKLQP